MLSVVVSHMVPHSMGKLLALPSYVPLARKILPRTNDLAYCVPPSVTEKKSFMTLISDRGRIRGTKTFSSSSLTNKLESLTHRDKTRVQMPEKMFPHLKLICLLFMGPTLGFDTKQRNSFSSNLVVFYYKSKILTILFIVEYEKIALFDEFLVLLGPIISRFFACSNEEKINKNNKECLLQSYLFTLTL